MSDVDLDAIRARCEAAAGPPWVVNDLRDAPDGNRECLWVDQDGHDDGETISHKTVAELNADEGISVIWSLADAEFIAHARQDVPALLALVDEQAARIAEFERQLAGATEVFRVEFHAYGGWHESVARYPDLDAAMERVRGSQKRYPERRFRVWRVARSEAVVWSSESAGGETAPESPAEASEHPRTRETGGTAA